MTRPPAPLPPARAERWLSRILPSHLTDALVGDLTETFAELVKERGLAAARRWYWREALRATVAFAFHDRSAPVRSGDSLLVSVLSDLRFGARLLLRRPGFAVLATVTLAIGIGATTAIFSVIQPILLASLPYPHADRIVTLWEGVDQTQRGNVGYATWYDIARDSHSFDASAVYKWWQAVITGDGPPERLSGARVSRDYFKVLGVEPALGRAFLPEDDVNNGPRVTILSDGLWRSHFGGDPSIVGRQVRFNGVSYTVIGVMPAGFEDLLRPTAQLWAPMQYDLTLPWACRTCHHLRAVARLKPGVSLGQAGAELNALSAGLVRAHPTEYAQAGHWLIPLREVITGGVRPLLLAILGAVALVLLIACANVMNLLLARGAQREGEFAMRTALGASRGRVVRQLLTESLALAAAGGILGVMVAGVGVKALLALTPAGLPRTGAIGIHAGTLLFAVALTTLVAVAFGLVPALNASRGGLHQSIKRNTRRAGGSHLVRASLVIAEVALALILLVGTGLLLQSVRRLLAVSPGFDPDHLMTLQIQVTGPRYDADSVTRGFYDHALLAARAVPGVTAAALTSQMPLTTDYDQAGVHLENHPRVNPEEDPSAHRYAVSAGYLATMKIPLLRGRDLDEHDVAGAPPVVLINDAFARRVWPGEDPIGQRIRIGDATSGPWWTIIGVVGNVRQVTLAADEPDGVYLPEAQWPWADGDVSLVVRTRGDPAALSDAIRRAVWSVDKDQPIVRLATMNQLLQASAAQRRFALVVFEAFAMVALILAAAGVYGVLAGVVTERRREIGVRSALGASRGDIIGMILGQGLSLTGVGVAVGIGCALAFTRLIAGLLFGISESDLSTYLGVITVLAAVALLACLVPAWRAARVDPAMTLRME